MEYAIFLNYNIELNKSLTSAVLITLVLQIIFHRLNCMKCFIWNSNYVCHLFHPYQFGIKNDTKYFYLVVLLISVPFRLKIIILKVLLWNTHISVFFWLPFRPESCLIIHWIQIQFSYVGKSHNMTVKGEILEVRLKCLFGQYH